MLTKSDTVQCRSAAAAGERPVRAEIGALAALNYWTPSPAGKWAAGYFPAGRRWEKEKLKNFFC